MNGQPVLVVVAFSSVTYPVTFTETGLPTNSEWWANVTGISRGSSTGTSVVLNLENGSYSFTASPLARDYGEASGTFSVAGGPVGVSVVFTLVVYMVTFRESGLPPGTGWWVNLTGQQSFAGAASQISFQVPNGTYNYVLATPKKSYSATSGSFAVSGNPDTIAVGFSLVTFSITFVESGLTSGVNWSVTLNGRDQSSSGTAITFSEPNATYSFSVGAVAGFSSNVTFGLVNLTGTPRTISIGFTTIAGGNSSPFKLSELDWLVIGVVVAAVVGLGITISGRRKGGRGFRQRSIERTTPPSPDRK